MRISHISHRLSAVAACALSALGISAAIPSTVSPDGKIEFVTALSPAGELTYTVSRDGREVVKPSRLGLVKHGKDLGKDVTLKNIERKSIDDSYLLKSGKKLEAHDKCQQTIYTYQTPGGETFDLIVRVYDDGAAFRYSLHGNAAVTDTIDAEVTEFSVPVDGRAWIHPFDWNERHKPSYEQYSMNNIPVNSLPDHDRGWAFPMLFELPAGGDWMMITEAYLDGSYPATHVDNSGTDGCYRIRFPEADEPIIADDPRPASRYPINTPWRAIIVGSLADVFANQMVSALNPPCAIEDTSWIKPGRSAWSWWYDGWTVRDFESQKRYIDFCRSMGWEYSLVDAGWQRMDGGGVDGLAEYAAKNGVGLWLWYHSGAGRDETSSTDGRLMSDPSLRRAEMKRISDLGVKGIKVDFFDTDKQRIIALYPAILKDAADYGLMVDFHGATLPRGFERTYPNLMTTEAIRGAETLGRAERCVRAAEHNATVPFTRNVVGSMDYTPVTFSFKVRQGLPAARMTSVAHQLALAVVFESGFQCFADRIEAYQALPELPQQLLKEVPAAWDESRLLAGYPSDYVVIARRKGDIWYIGGINGKDEVRQVSFNLPDECAGKEFTLITDGDGIDSFGYSGMKGDGRPVAVKMLGNGGFAAVIK